ncbi:hypothetical protein [Nocardioides sp. R-C-SC26]|uniref:hypothetical protein n=1 Tax=Nocardioides sp. R-C-SC26 TaxID=2870414 RepID=UPI001E44B071|nr:hypothetical protein [Nocardioides sp. R-C-SC26]
MTSLHHPTRTTSDPTRLAAAARSILACPAGVNLVVEGVDDVLADADDLGMQDLGGVPVFSCAPGTALGRAAADRRRALLVLESGLGPVGSSDRGATLSLGGFLVHRGDDRCDCCEDVRERVELEVDMVMLTRTAERDTTTSFLLDVDERGLGVRVSLDEFASPAHALNRGFLQRSTEHANSCHQDELRRAVSTITGTRLAEVIGVSLRDLNPRSVQIQWVDTSGAHATSLDFAHTARSTDELGDLLRERLHAGLC